MTCCGQRRTNYNDIFPNRFIPAPVPFVHNESGIVAAAVGSGVGKYGSLVQRLALSRLEPAHNYMVMPFGMYCPSVTCQIHKRVCECGKYFPSQAAVKAHKIVHQSSNVAEHEENAEDDRH